MTYQNDLTSHEGIAKRLARVAGHAQSLKRFWAEGRDGEDMLTQIAAVRAALDQTGKAILQHHIELCVAKAVEQGNADEAIQELKAALNRFV
jgi:DNA-binding FrmR family transcriptional regulator